MIPPAVWGFLLRWLAVLAAAGGLFVGGWFKGSGHVREQWEQARITAEQQAEAERNRQQNKISALTLALSKAKARREVVTKTVVKEVEKYVPNSLPMLPSSFRLWHDSAVQGEAPGDTAGVVDAPVSPQDVARTIRQNYAQCLDEQERLEALQQIVRTLKGE